MTSLSGYPQHSAVEAIFCCFQVIITSMAGVGKLTLPSTVGAFSRIFAFEHPSSHLGRQALLTIYQYTICRRLFGRYDSQYSLSFSLS